MRVAVASWNANERLQKAKKGQLDLSSWFEPHRSNGEKDHYSQRGPPEIYAIGFQESVPLPLALTGLGAAQLPRYDADIQDAVQRHAQTCHKTDDEKHSSNYRTRTITIEMLLRLTTI